MAQTLEHNEAITQVVPITVPSCDVDVTVIQQLDDEPNDVGGLSATELKAKFDETNAAMKRYLNDELIPSVVGADATEQARQEAEAERVSNEIERVSNESARVAAETARQDLETGYVAQAASSATASAAAASAAAASASDALGYAGTAAVRATEAAGWADDAKTAKNAAAGSASAAAASAQNAAGSATRAQSWAVGGTGTRSGEDTNNAKYWAEQAAGAIVGVTSFNGRSGAVTPQSGDYTAEQVGAIPASAKGAANGVATLDNGGKVPSGQLPEMDYIPTSVTFLIYYDSNDNLQCSVDGNFEKFMEAVVSMLDFPPSSTPTARKIDANVLYLSNYLKLEQVPISSFILGEDMHGASFHGIDIVTEGYYSNFEIIWTESGVTVRTWEPS